MSEGSAAQRADRAVSQIDEALNDYVTWYGSDDSCSMSFAESDPENDTVLPTGDLLPAVPESRSIGDHWHQQLASRVVSLSDYVVSFDLVDRQLQRRSAEAAYQRAVSQSHQMINGVASLPQMMAAEYACLVCGNPVSGLSYWADWDEEEEALVRYFRSEWVPVRVSFRTRVIEYEPCGHRISLPTRNPVEF